MIPFLAAVFVASRSFVETKLTYNMFSRLIPALKSVLDARCNRERRRCRNSEEFNHHGMFIQLLPLFHVISIEKRFVCFCFFLACNRFNGLNFIVDCCVGLWSFSFGYANNKKTKKWQFLLPSIGFLTADPGFINWHQILDTVRPCLLGEQFLWPGHAFRLASQHYRDWLNSSTFQPGRIEDFRWDTWKKQAVWDNKTGGCTILLGTKKSNLWKRNII